MASFLVKLARLYSSAEGPPPKHRRLDQCGGWERGRDEEKAAKVCIKAFTCADTGRTDKAEAREHKQPWSVHCRYAEFSSHASVSISILFGYC